MSKQDKQYNNPYVTELDAFATYDNKHNISAYDFKLILKTFFCALQYDMIHTGTGYTLPYHLGNLSVRKKPLGKSSRGLFDFQYFKETGLKRWIKNNHSSQYVAHYYWNTKKGMLDRSLPNHVF
jgi:hypothetical protein